ncbi:hypothetical protein GCM10027429_14060 [Marivirga atlantica]|uniref:Uncharacterized protein n=1 Tax=Marivirga atlantica TaxID=1548457 RepID=A0A937DJA9_9BACT|nr:hypothetical protein [Marivirga atlantica]MBL0765021.1 hypothetical protein [Marivirga atlantica]
MITKEKLKEEIDKFPNEEISVDELIDHLIFIEKLEGRIKLSEEGKNVISNDVLKEEISKWSK